MGFIFGGKTGETQESLKRKRAYAEALNATRGAPKNVGEGLTEMGNAIAYRMALSQIGKGEAAMAEKNSALMAPIVESFGGGAQQFPEPPASPSAPQETAKYSPNEAVAAQMAGQPVSGSMANARAVDRASVANYSGDVRQDTPNYAGGSMAGKIAETASALGIDPVDLATTISYETGGTFNPTKRGPTTQYGQHRGLIQFGEPQAKEMGVDWKNPVDSQLGANGAVAKYLRNAGVKPGMGMLDLYSAVNAGRVGRYNASDANNGGAPGTVRDKVTNQMAGHRTKAQAYMAALNGAGPQTTVAAAPFAYDMEANIGNKSPLADAGMQANTGSKQPLSDQGIQVASLDPSIGMGAQPQSMYVGEVGANGAISTKERPAANAIRKMLGGQEQPAPVQVAQAAPQGQVSEQQVVQELFGSPAPRPQLNPGMLMQALSDPNISEQNRATLQGLLQNEMKKADPAYQAQQQMDQIGLQKAQIELERLKSGTPADPLEAQYKQMQIKKMEAEIAKAGQPDAAPNRPSSIQEYEYFTKLDPEQQKRYLAVKRSQQTVDLGTGYGVLDPTNPGQIGAQIPKDIEGKVLAEAAAKDKGENLALLNSMKAKMPGLETVVKELNDIGKDATYTLSGQIFNEGRKQLGMAPSDGAVARTKYAAVVANQVLPLLRDTFGAQFTAAEGNRLLATLGDPDVSPAEKEAVLQSFIDQKKRDIEGLAVQTGQQPAQPAQAAPSGDLKSKYGLE